MNNFKQLEQQMESRYDQSADAIKKNVKVQRNFWTVMGDITELYIPKVVSTIIGAQSLTKSIGKPNDIRYKK